LVASKANFGSFGETRYWPAGESVYHNLQGYNRLLSTAGTDRSICGLAVAVNPVWIGGYSYLHRDIPAFQIDGSKFPNLATVPRGANAVLMDQGFKVPAGFTSVASSRGVVLVERRGGCGLPPRGYTRDFPRS
jgi:hypothetical protein